MRTTYHVCTKGNIFSQNPKLSGTSKNASYSALEKKRFAKFALANIEGAHQAFNRIFGGTRKANDYPTVRLLDAGVPTFLWTK